MYGNAWNSQIGGLFRRAQVSEKRIVVLSGVWLGSDVGEGTRLLSRGCWRREEGGREGYANEAEEEVGEEGFGDK